MRNNILKKASILCIIIFFISSGFVSGYQSDNINDCLSNYIDDNQKYKNKLKNQILDSYEISYNNPPVICDLIKINELDSIRNDNLNNVNINVNLPDYFSWRDYEGKDWTTSAKNQGGKCGCCGVFAAIGILESVINIREGCSNLNPDLSEQYVLSCLPDAALTSGEGCNGGMGIRALQLMKENTSQGNNYNGALFESCFPYMESDDIPCSDKPEDWLDKLVPILDCGIISLGQDSVNSRETIKSQIIQTGPVTAYLQVPLNPNIFHNWGYRNHKSTDYFPDIEEDLTVLNHEVIIVGWKDDPSIGNGGYWICKNSWDTDWGYNGFCNIEYGGLFLGYLIEWVDYNPEDFNWDPKADAGELYHINVGQEIEFNGSRSFDPEGDIFTYNWNFGDGTRSEDISPIHIYSQKGIYIVELTLKDANNNTYKDHTLVGVDESPITIDISGGLGISINIVNPVDIELLDLKWSIKLDGLLITRDNLNGFIKKLYYNETEKITLSLLGIGKGSITINVDNFSKTVNIIMIGPFVVPTYSDDITIDSIQQTIMKIGGFS